MSEADETRAFAALQTAMGTLHNEAATVIAGLRAQGYAIVPASQPVLREALELADFVMSGIGWLEGTDPTHSAMSREDKERMEALAEAVAALTNPTSNPKDT